MSAPQIIRPLSPSANQLWKQFRTQLDAAAAPFTGGKPLPLSPFYAHDIAQIDAELTRQLAAMPTNTTAQFVQDGACNLSIQFTTMKGGTP